MLGESINPPGHRPLWGGGEVCSTGVCGVGVGGSSGAQLSSAHGRPVPEPLTPPWC